MMIAAKLPAVSSLDRDSTGIQLTPDEFDAIEEFKPGYVYELVNGVVLVSPPPGIGERSPNDVLGYLIRTFREDHSNGHCVDETVPAQQIRIRNGRRRADRAIWIGLGRDPDEAADIPTIAVEFVSERPRDLRRDHFEKRYEYAETGVAEYWVIDRFQRTMTVYRGETEQSTLQAGQTHTTDLLPGFELPLDKILAVSDRYTD